MSHPLPTDVVDSNSRKAILKRQTKGSAQYKKSVEIAQAALTEFEGARVHPIHKQPKELFNPKYEHLTKMKGSIHGMGRSDLALPAKKAESKKKQKKSKPEELTTSIWSIDYEQFEMPGEESSSGIGPSDSSQESNAPVGQHPSTSHSDNSPNSTDTGHHSETSNEDNEHNLREFNICSTDAIPIEGFLDQIPVSNIDDLNNLDMSANTASMKSKGLGEALEYLNDGENSSSNSSSSAIVTFHNTLFDEERPESQISTNGNVQGRTESPRVSTPSSGTDERLDIYRSGIITQWADDPISRDSQFSESDADDTPITNIDDLVNSSDFPQSSHL